jgi:hypothetical protein
VHTDPPARSAGPSPSEMPVTARLSALPSSRPGLFAPTIYSRYTLGVGWPA